MKCCSTNSQFFCLLCIVLGNYYPDPDPDPVETGKHFAFAHNIRYVMLYCKMTGPCKYPILYGESLSLLGAKVSFASLLFPGTFVRLETVKVRRNDSFTVHAEGLEQCKQCSVLANSNEVITSKHGLCCPTPYAATLLAAETEMSLNKAKLLALAKHLEFDPCSVRELYHK